MGYGYVFTLIFFLLLFNRAIFVHKAILPLITGVRSHAVPTGICNTMGNKGGIGIALNVRDTSFCFLTAHLAAHQEQFDRRTVEFASISNEVAKKLGHNFSSVYDDTDTDTDADGTTKGVKKGATKNDSIRFGEISPTATTSTATSTTVGNDSIREELKPLTGNSSNDSTTDSHEGRGGRGSSSPCSSKSFCRPCQCDRCCGETDYTKDMNPLLREFDYVFWGGDLNYRINATRDVVNSLLKENRHDVLVANDQLSLLLQFEKTFSGFVEGKITFRPTYKYDKGKG